MKAIILENAGSVGNLRISEIEKPEIKENEVLVKTKSISINPVDYKVRAIDEVLAMIMGETRPAILGWDISGEVTKIGSKVTNFKVGDKVFGMVNFPGQGNAYAEYVAAPENHLAKMPENISFEVAAASTLAALTALQAMEGKVKNSDRVLIHAGSGGVGHYAIQIAKSYGAHVISTSSGKNRDFILSLGADEHIDYREQKFEEVLSDIDFVLDSFNGEILHNSVKVAKNGATIVSLPSPEFSEETVNLANEKNVDLSFIMVKSDAKDMNTLKEMLEIGTLKSHVSKTFNFDEMGKAHLELESGRTVGKVVVNV